ncbi:putative aminoglycoside phosphotransferase [Mycobacterium sp. JS623]|uniref:phosphotransferase family protein n=1 Tax=Mycobacterium sp. JS623 TaxID=212767 RepID=UPI0002A564FA|nr:phosphotransferase family protein [Mycobacterium sp. JS623]AGB23638.1 putative aminoglycoside phosphotransferase [Mycobacterium sp. JS623]
MTSRPAADEIAALLEPIARQRIAGAADARIANWLAAERGLSTETFLFDLEHDDDPTTLKQLVFRRPPEISIFPDYDLTRQVMVMNRLRDTPISVPTVYWLDREGTDLGTPYYVMEQLPTIGTAADYPSYHSHGLYYDATPQQRSTMWWGCVQAIADVHALDWRSLRLEKLLMPQRGEHPLEQVVEYCDELLTWGSPASRPKELVDAVKWLRDNVYEPEHLVLCWGDSRLSNVLYGPDYEVTAVLDWELAYIGDHEADLAWLLFVDWACAEYQGVPRLDGTPSREETIDRYEQLSGRTVRNLRYNEVLAAVELGIPVSRLETRLRNQGLLTGDLALTGFCVERIRQLLG